MLTDARSIPDETLIDTDVCIVGSGAAGITLAKEFMGSAFRVTLIESGNLDFEPDTQSLYKGENVGHSYFPLDACRMRYLGGTTNHWGGTCRPLDRSDFEVRDWIPHSGWPFPKTELDPYYARAQPILQLGPYAYDADFWHTDKDPVLPLGNERLYTAIFQQSPPTRFGEVYRPELTQDSNVVTFVHANVVDIETNETASEVTRLRIATLAGNRFWIRGKVFVLATGGIEVPRMLLTSNRVQKAGLGNQNDLVGRYFLEHPILFVGTVALSDPKTSTSLYEKHTLKDTVIKGFLAPTPDTQRRLKLLNFGARPTLTRWKSLSKGVASYEALRRSYREGRLPNHLFEHLYNVISDIDDVYRSRNSPPKLLSLKFWQESAPNPDSRVRLNDEKDALGLNRIDLDWRLTEQDKNNMALALKLVGEELGRAGIGRLHLAKDFEELWAKRIAGSYHHMGTTRMSDDPRKGVVDRDTKVHGVANLYIASSSVFPVTGHANPTLTIVALAVRLADRIKGLMA